MFVCLFSPITSINNINNITPPSKIGEHQPLKNTHFFRIILQHLIFFNFSIVHGGFSPQLSNDAADDDDDDCSFFDDDDDC